MMLTMKEQNKKPYANLTPESVLKAVEALAGPATGAVFPLNSYENRVYDVALEKGENVIAKFYRPERWSRETIMEEHRFSLELAQEEVPVVAPLMFNGKTLFEHDGYLYSLFPKRGGRPFEVATEEDLRQLGRLLARLHQVGGRGSFKHRPVLDVQTAGHDNTGAILSCETMPDELRTPLKAIMDHTLENCERIWQQNPPRTLRLHGDCHAGNILVAQEPFLVDMDDCLTGPAVQDIWMLTAGQLAPTDREITLLLEGYETFREFDRSELRLTEVLRSLRMIQYTAWLAQRWHDPTFPKNFPFFERADYWQNLIGNLQEQLALLSEV